MSLRLAEAAAGLLGSRGRVAETLRVDPIGCKAHGLCAELFPEWITLDDWGYPIIDARSVPPELRDHAIRAVNACPALALRLARDRGR